MRRSAPSRRHLVRVVIIAALMTQAGCSEAPKEANAPKRPVLVVDVRPQNTEIFGPFAGTVDPRYESDQGFRASGRMIKRDADVGDIVAKGRLLASLDQTILRFSVEQSNADVLNAEAQLDKANIEDKRKKALITSGAVAQSDVDSASADQKTAAAKLNQAKASLQKAEDQLSYANLYAEYDGVVMAWKAEVGQDVSDGTSVVTIARSDVKEAVVDIPDDLIGDVHEKATFDVKLQSADALLAKGIVREIAPGSDNATRTRRVRFTLDHPPDAFRLGSTISVSLSRPIPPRIEIPEGALLETDRGTRIWIVGKGGDTAAQRDVTVMGHGNGSVIIKGSINEGDRVVIAGIHELKDGQTVRTETHFP